MESSACCFQAAAAPWLTARSSPAFGDRAVLGVKLDGESTGGTCERQQTHLEASRCRRRLQNSVQLDGAAAAACEVWLWRDKNRDREKVRGGARQLRNLNAELEKDWPMVVR